MKAPNFLLGIRSKVRTSVETPDAGQRTLFAKSDAWYDIDSSGVETKLGGGSATGSDTFAFFSG